MSSNSSENTETTTNLIENFWKMMTTASVFEVQSSESPNMFVNPKALQMMSKMGFKSGTGLGKEQEGRINPINLPVNLGKRGFGLKIAGLEASDTTWDFSQEIITVQEKIEWISSVRTKWCSVFEALQSWMIKGPAKLTIDDETRFCDPLLLQRVLKAKGVFDELDAMELCKARARANPFETIRSAFFMNRAALKMANIDAVANFIFTDIDRNPHHSKRKGPYYFADVCAGPGGFSEYILWRKRWLFKGFGFTLKGEHDFELAESQCASPVTFSAQYGFYDNGDVCCPENIKHFADRVLHESDGLGVHFMMSDGGFSVEGNENLQEVLSKQLYVCQCLMALEIVRPHGHFVTKLFDLFTSFSVGLIFLMYNCFEKIAIFKPNTSRPANSERYLICYGLKSGAQMIEIRKYLSKIACELWQLRQLQKDFSVDISEIVPMSVILADEEFYNYITESNNRIGANQIVGLSKLTAFCKNPALIEPRQEELRSECLKYWRIPDKPKVPLPRFTTSDLLSKAVRNPDFMFSQPRQVYDMKHLINLLKDLKDWHYILSGCSQKTNIRNFYAGVGGSRVYRLQKCKWVKVKKLELIRGTLLYGEMIKENVIEKFADYETQIQRQSLHVIDALRLGETSLADLPFTERLDLIETYCRAVNHESRADHARIRVKVAHPLQTLIPETEDNYSILPTLGFNSIKENYLVNSILLLKTDEDQQFNSTFTSRIQIFINKDAQDDSGNRITLGSLIDLIKSGT